MIKRQSPVTSVLILTAYDDQHIFALLDAGAAGYLLKSVRGEELAQAVRAVAEGGRADLAAPGAVSPRWALRTARAKPIGCLT